MIQAVILVFTLSGYLAAKQAGIGIDLSQAKCKAELYDMNKQTIIFSDCLTNTHPGFKLDLTQLAEEEKDDIEICFAQENGVLSKSDPPAFNLTQAIKRTTEYNKDTDPKVLKELLDAADACAKEYDPETEGVAVLKCCYKAGSKICFGIDADSLI